MTTFVKCYSEIMVYRYYRTIELSLFGFFGGLLALLHVTVDTAQLLLPSFLAVQCEIFLAQNERWPKDNYDWGCATIYYHLHMRLGQHLQYHIWGMNIHLPAIFMQTEGDSMGL